VLICLEIQCAQCANNSNDRFCSMRVRQKNYTTKIFAVFSAIA